MRAYIQVHLNVIHCCRHEQSVHRTYGRLVGHLYCFLCVQSCQLSAANLCRHAHMRGVIYRYKAQVQHIFKSVVVYFCLCLFSVFKLCCVYSMFSVKCDIAIRRVHTGCEQVTTRCVRKSPTARNLLTSRGNLLFFICACILSPCTLCRLVRGTPGCIAHFLPQCLP